MSDEPERRQGPFERIASACLFALGNLLFWVFWGYAPKEGER